MLTTAAPNSADRIPASAEPLLTSAGFAGPFQFVQLRGSANNKVFRVTGSDGITLALKQYFRHPADQRDRAIAEFAFSTFAWTNGVCIIPRPYGYDRQYQLGLYEFLMGRSARPGEIAESAVRAALQFIQAINRHKMLPSARELPNASESCFSFFQHVQCVERRFNALRTIESRSAIDREAIAFLKGPLTEVWTRTREVALRQAEQAGLMIDQELGWGDRCISPSDFGFHNAIFTADNVWQFIDFEYAGWDDPAKLVCDFFCQPAFPVPFQYFEWVATQMTADMSKPTLQFRRIHLLYPVYQVKWCCILLNDFLQLGSDRRQFACGAEGEEVRKTRQLEKAQRALTQVAQT